MRQSLRVAYTIEQCWHRVPGGTAVAALATARALSARPDVEIVGVAARHSSPPPKPWTPPVPVRHLRLPRPLLYESWRRLRKPRIEGATGPVDVIHATTIAMPPRSRPIVMTMHDVAFIHYPEHFTRRGLRFFTSNLKTALREADIVLCPSRATMRDCGRAGFPNDKLRLVPLGVDVVRAGESEVERVRRRYALDRAYILFTGTIEPRKNLRGLLRAFRALDATVDLVIAGPKGWNEDLDSLVGAARARVRVLGFVPEGDLRALYAGASVFCYPSWLEGFGFPVLEAMAQGTPVVTSSGTSTEELAVGAGVIVDPGEPEAIAAGIRSLLEDEDLARRLGEAGLARAVKFTWERTAEGVARAYAEVAEAG